MAAYEIRIYQTADRKQPFAEWIEGLTDAQARARIQARLARVACGNFGDHKPVGDGVLELRIDWGPGYRVYFARVGSALLILLCGGEKAKPGGGHQSCEKLPRRFQGALGGDTRHARAASQAPRQAWRMRVG